MSITPCLSLADPSFKPPPTPSRPHPSRICRCSLKCQQPSSCLLLDGENEVRWESCDTILSWHSMTWCIPICWAPWAHIYRVGLVWNVCCEHTQLAGICARLQSAHTYWHCVGEWQVLLCWLLWGGCQWRRLLMRFSEFQQGHPAWWSLGPWRLLFWNVCLVPLRWAKQLISFSEAKNSPVLSPLQREAVHLSARTRVVVHLPCTFPFVIVYLCAAILNGIIHLSLPKLQISKDHNGHVHFTRIWTCFLTDIYIQMGFFSETVKKKGLW